MPAVRIEDMELEISLLTATVEFDYLIAHWGNSETVSSLSKKAGVRDVRDALELNNLEVADAGTTAILDQIHDSLRDYEYQVGGYLPRSHQRPQLPPPPRDHPLSPERLQEDWTPTQAFPKHGYIS